MASLRWDQRNVAAAGSAFGVVLLCGVPLIWLATGLGRTSVWSSESWADEVFANSLALAFTAAIVASMLGAVAALMLNRLSSTGLRWFLLVLCLPLFLPSYLHALAWSSLSASDGLTGAAISSWLRGHGAAISAWVLAVSYFPIAMVLLVSALTRWDKRWEWSVWAHGGGPTAVFALKARYFGGPVVAACLIVFLLAFSDFAVPDFFQVRTYSTDIFVQVSSYLDISAASLLSVPVILVTMIAFAMLVRLLGRMTRATSSEAYRDSRQARNKGSLKLTVLLLTCLAAVVVVLPLAELVKQADSIDVLVEAFVMIWADALTGAGIAAACALLGVMVSIFAAYACDRGVWPAGVWLRLLPVAMFAIPASLIGLALIGIWNRPYPLGWFYDAGIVLVLAITARWLPVSFEILAQGWRHCGKAQEAADLTVGRSWSSVFCGVLLSPMRPAILAAIFVTFIFAFNELTLVTLLAPPGLSTVPLRLFQTVHYGPESLLAAICVWQAVFLVSPLVVLAAVTRRWQPRGS